MAWPKVQSGPSLTRIRNMRRVASRLAATTKQPGATYQAAHRNYCEWLEAVGEAEALLTLERVGCVHYHGPHGKSAHSRCDRHGDIDETIDVPEREEAALMQFAREHPDDAGWVRRALVFRRRVRVAVAELRRVVAEKARAA
jgi:hypothetical protein